MIARLEGRIVGIRGGSIVLAVGGPASNAESVASAGWVGYQVSVTTHTLGKLAGEERAAFHIHTHVREDAFLLYGFLEESELLMFELLISVGGIGPKVALSILSIADPKTLTTAIYHKDPSILTRVSGVGKRTAERIIVELQNKVEGLEMGDTAGALADQEVLDALQALGYSVTQAREALKAVAPETTEVSARIRQALKHLGK